MLLIQTHFQMVSICIILHRHEMLRNHARIACRRCLSDCGWNCGIPQNGSSILFCLETYHCNNCTQQWIRCLPLGNIGTCGTQDCWYPLFVSSTNKNYQDCFEELTLYKGLLPYPLSLSLLFVM